MMEREENHTSKSSLEEQADEELQCQTRSAGEGSSIIGNESSVFLPASCFPDHIAFSLDIGGTLAKLAYPTHVNCQSSHIASEETLKHIKLVTFDTDKVEEWLSYICETVLGSMSSTRGTCHARATGTGCIKYYDKILTKMPFLNLQVDCKEMDHCLLGIDVLWRQLTADQLLYDHSDLAGLEFKTPLVSAGLLPCIIANLGSALTIVQVNQQGIVEGIVGGSSQGGLAFLGLGLLLTKAKSFEDLIKLALCGDHLALDLLVRDTAGSEYNETASDVVVSSFGKIAKLRPLQPDMHFKQEDVASSLLYCITEEMAKTIYLVAKAQNVHTAILCGSFLTNNSAAIKHIGAKSAICSAYLKHGLRMLFLKYEAYLGAIGALMKNQNSTIPDANSTG